MRRRRIILIILLILAALVLINRISKERKLSPTSSPLTPSPTMTDIKIEKITDLGGRVAWNKGSNHNLVAYDSIADGKTANTELYIMNPDGSGVRCVTCSSLIPKGFVGQPDWHPNGEYLVIQAENQNSQHKFYNHMAWGINQDLWLISRDGVKAEKIWISPLNNAALHPHFNQQGNKIGFSERIATGKSRLILKLITPGGENPWEGWQIHIADFDINKNGEQKLSNHRTLKPNGDGFYEFHGFLPNNDIVYSFTRITGEEAYVDDSYVANLSGQVLRNLTSSPSTWDEHGQYSPSLQSYAFMSSRFDSSWQAPQSKGDTLKTELYLRDQTGKINKLTGFNESNDGKRYLVSDFDWDREGRRIIFQVAPFNGNTPESPQLWMITFPKAQ